jgi:hypothetical protein
MKPGLWTLAVLAAGGCLGRNVDVGSQDAGPTEMGNPETTNEPCANGPQAPILGAWTGYVENQKWASGSDEIRMVITGANATQICGTVSLGSAPAPAPPSDPTVAYPPGEFDPTGTPGSWDNQGSLIKYAEGFVMPIAGAKIAGKRLTFQANWALPWKPWCALQTPVDVSVAGNGPTFACVGNVGTDDTGCHLVPSGTLIDCGTLLIAGSICTYTPQGCTAGDQACDSLSFDMQVSGDSTSGSVALGCTGVHNIHLSRIP